MIHSTFCKDIVDTIEKIVKDNNQSENILLHEPYFKDNKALNYLKDCIDTAWVSTSGHWVMKFENEIKKITGSKYAVAVSSGTVGLRLALFCVGVKEDNEVIIPPLTFIATANAVAHLKAYPHFVDIDKSTLGIDPMKLANHLEQIAEKKDGNVINKKTGKRIGAIVLVHVFGIPARINEIVNIANEWNLPLVEDAAEALGSKTDNKSCGTFGSIGVFSFNGNKIITTGGGGILVTDNENIAIKAKHLSTTAKVEDENGNIFHDQIGWNDRLPNINAALGFAQLEVLNKRVKFKRLLARKYIDAFKSINKVKIISERSKNELSNYWLITLVLDNNLNDTSLLRNEIISIARKRNIQLRPCWQLLHETKMYKNCFKSNLENSESIAKLLISMPSSPQLIMK
tara:strand:- start:12519 stop:13718 length:1200 start_codon:yes stop_codon:yes gene_type:complete